MGEVYLAHDTQLERQVALKTPRLELAAGADVVARFQREAKAMAQLQHPNLCPIFDVDQIEERLYLTMAFIDGEPLTSRLVAERPLACVEIARLVRGIASGLSEAHRSGVVHRDLKPGNVLIDDRNEPIVTDFGLAFDRASAESRLSVQALQPDVAIPTTCPRVKAASYLRRGIW
ncbi:MAG: hypothetical protein CMJ64_23425 [Planctomycetaceae bacterium]|nr:hypothetical protein [Planctomycetaceae bacterium]